MLTIIKDPALTDRNIHFAYAEVWYSPGEAWDVDGFRSLVEQELGKMAIAFSNYDRKEVFGNDPYVRFFKKFKKTYPVMQQFESILFKGRPFPHYNPVTDVAFFLELTTRALSGTHDADRIDGELEVYLSLDRQDFPGMRGVDFHTYPGDVCGRDGQGIIFSMIAGADSRTCGQPDTIHVLYPVFGTPDMTAEQLQSPLDILVSYVHTLCPDARVVTGIL